MASSFELLQTRERLLVARRFLVLRPQIAALGAAGNALFLASSATPPIQKLVLGTMLAVTVAAFFGEAWWLRNHKLTERWLLSSLSLTLAVLSLGAWLSGSLESPLLPLLFAPVVVGFAAFARTAQSAVLFAIALVALLFLILVRPAQEFLALPVPAATRMLFVSTLVSLALLAVGVIGLVDAHERVASQLERMRTDMLAEAERRAASVEHLGAQVAHEVKNPLTAVRGLVQLVQRNTENPNDQKRLAVVLIEVDRALDALKGYLGFARPLTDLSLFEVNVRSLLEDIAGVLEARAREYAVTIVVTGDATPALFDRQRLRDAILNLALNAISAMPGGGTLELHVAESDGLTRITIHDEGRGMSAEMLARVGEPFASSTEGGTGLGVLVARGVARQHGGELHFESSPGKGTRATLELPNRAQYPSKLTSR